MIMVNSQLPMQFMEEALNSHILTKELECGGKAISIMVDISSHKSESKIE